jgi:chemotaxis protein CheC
MKVEEKHRDVLLEIINIGIGKGANVLNQIVKHHVTLEVPSLEIFDQASFAKFLQKWEGEKYAAVEMEFSSSFSGSGLLIFPTEKATTLVHLFTQEVKQKDDIEVLNISALTEIGNIIINSVFSTLSEQFSIEFKYSLPEYRHGHIEDIIRFGGDQDRRNIILLCKTSFHVIDLDIQGNLILIFEIQTFNELLAMIDQFYLNLFKK